MAKTKERKRDPETMKDELWEVQQMVREGLMDTKTANTIGSLTRTLLSVVNTEIKLAKLSPKKAGRPRKVNF